MKVNVLKEAGREEALLGLSLSYNAPIEKMGKVAERLSPKDGGHNKFLESIAVWLDITAPRYWWQQFDTYRVGTSRQSESTMHTWKKFPFAPDMFTRGTSKVVINMLELMRQQRDFDGIKRNLPEGFLQRRIVFTNYKTLRHIINQRSTHKLEEWEIFCKEVMNQVEYPSYLS